MSFKTEYPQYAPIESYIHEEHLEREVAIAETLAGWVVRAVQAMSRPPRPAPFVVEEDDRHHPHVTIFAPR